MDFGLFCPFLFVTISIMLNAILTGLFITFLIILLKTYIMLCKYL